MFDCAENAFGSVDILVNNATDYIADTFRPAAPSKNREPLWEGSPIASGITAETHDRHFNVNSRAVALAMAEFARRFVKR